MGVCVCVSKSARAGREGVSNSKGERKRGRTVHTIDRPGIVASFIVCRSSRIPSVKSMRIIIYPFFYKSHPPPAPPPPHSSNLSPREKNNRDQSSPLPSIFVKKSKRPHPRSPLPPPTHDY